MATERAKQLATVRSRAEARDLAAALLCCARARVAAAEAAQAVEAAQEARGLAERIGDARRAALAACGAPRGPRPGHGWPWAPRRRGEGLQPHEGQPGAAGGREGLGTGARDLRREDRGDRLAMQLRGLHPWPASRRGLKGW